VIRNGPAGFGRGASEKDRKAPRRRPTSAADLALKERALARTSPLDSTPGRYRPPDALLRFLDEL
jgi:hypothetical protein